MRKRYKSIEEFIKDFPAETQVILQKVRNTIKETVPDAQEVISYNIPSFQLNGSYVIYFAGYKNHIGLYPIPRGNESFNKKIATFVKGKGTIQFPLNQPIPLDLIKQMTLLLKKDNQERVKLKKY